VTASIFYLTHEKGKNRKTETNCHTISHNEPTHKNTIAKRKNPPHNITPSDFTTHHPIIITTTLPLHNAVLFEVFSEITDL
jgi:hypothetical protein